MEQDREIDRVLMNIKQHTGTISYLMFLSVRANIMLLSYFLRLAKKSMVSRGFTDSYKDFLQRTEGNFSVYNIPVTGTSAENLQKLNALEIQLQENASPFEAAKLRNEIKDLQEKIPEIEQLKRLGLDYCVLPKLNGSEKTIQVAIPNTETQPFKNWFMNHLLSQLSGGEKDLEEIKALTEGNYSIFNVPFEGDELKEALPDFDILGINYTVLPDLKVGDNNSQIAIANADKDKLITWFQMWKDKQLSQGKEAGSLYEMNPSSYMDTGEIDQGDYVANSDRKYQEVNEEFEKNSTLPTWEEPLRNANSEEYVKYLQNKNYEKISINKETLVDNMHADVLKKGYFTSRVPGTYGDKQETLLIPSKQVFITDDGQTYIAFLLKSGKTLVADRQGNIFEKEFEEVYKPYAKVSRNFKNVQKLTKNVTPEQGVKSTDEPGYKNRFNNFKGRDYDMAELEKQLLKL